MDKIKQDLLMVFSLAGKPKKSSFMTKEERKRDLINSGIVKFKKEVYKNRKYRKQGEYFLDEIKLKEILINIGIANSWEDVDEKFNRFIKLFKKLTPGYGGDNRGIYYSNNGTKWIYLDVVSDEIMGHTLYRIRSW